MAPAGFVDSQNLHRRHLSAEWRREQVKAKRAEGKSTRQIAEELGTTAMTVSRDLNRGVTGVTPEPERPATITGKDKKQYAAKRPQPKPPARPATRTPDPKPDTAVPWAEVI
jgi:IS30 family transposase